MSFSADPYRTLGLVPGASLEDVKHAYRRLAKRYHPDSAGEQEVARFLAIQAAYERIVGGPAGGGRRTAPWDADQSRARATRQAYRGRAGPGRAGGATGAGEPRGSNGGWAGGSWWSAGRPGEPGKRSDDRSRGRPADGGPASGRGAGGRRKATLNSTSYDEATGQPRDPDWDGSTWYGASSGTYWTINPKEYADPRKHGPEYQARARRAAGTPADGDRVRADTGRPGEAPGPGTSPWDGPPPAANGPATHGTSAWARPPRPASTPRAWAVETPPRSSPAATVGLLAGLVTAVPATLVLLGSGLGGGDPLLAALLAPVIVGLVSWLAVTILGRRSASSPP